MAPGTASWRLGAPQTAHSWPRLPGTVIVTLCHDYTVTIQVSLSHSHNHTVLAVTLHGCKFQEAVATQCSPCTT